jgi:hypothetical protein
MGFNSGFKGLNWNKMYTLKEEHKHVFSEVKDSDADISVLFLPVHLHPTLEAS